MSSHERGTNANQVTQGPLGEIASGQKSDPAIHQAEVITNGQTTGTNGVGGDFFIEDSSGLNPWGGASSQQSVVNGNNQDSGSRPVRSASRASVGERAIMNTKRLAIAHDASSARMPYVIHAVKSAPTVLKSRRSSRRSVLSQGSSKSQQHDTDAPPTVQTKCGTFLTAAMSSSRTENSADLDTSHGSNDRMGAMPAGKALVMKPGIGLPSVADTCGGVVIRLSPSERPLDPWDHLIAPLRAICDIEASLSRAGIEYRGVIPAVAEGQELMSHDQLKVRMVTSTRRHISRVGICGSL